MLSTAHANRPRVDNSGKPDKDENAVKILVAFWAVYRSNGPIARLPPCAKK